MYKIHVLSNEDFDNLSSEITKGSQIHDSLGFANRDRGEAYVRYTAHPELQKYLINHELEELVDAESMHEDENGIRHKKARDFFSNLFRTLSFGITDFGVGKDQSQQGGLLGSLFSKPEPITNVPYNQERAGIGGSFGQFAVPGQSATSRLPESLMDQGGGLKGGLQVPGLSQEEQQRQKGNYAGRYAF